MRRTTALTTLILSAGLLVGAFLHPQRAQAQFLFEPESTNLVFAYCFNQFGEVVPNCNVQLFNGYYVTPFQHNHSTPPPPVSGLFPSFGNTGTTGLPVNIATTQIGQIEGVYVCADFCTLSDYLVAYSDLLQLGTSVYWVLIGATTSHPNNHYAQLTMGSMIQAVASQYSAEFPAYPVIAINDMALPWGGRFDLNQNWAAPHSQHSRGKAVDIRGNGNPNSIPRIPAVQERFMQICRDYGATLVLHESQGTGNEHFHCQWP